MKALINSVPYPELFWSQYTSLGSQTQTPKCSKVLISGVSFRQCSLLQSQESDVLSYSDCKIAKHFQGFAPGPHWRGLTAPPQTPWLHSQKIAGYSTEWYNSVIWQRFPCMLLWQNRQDYKNTFLWLSIPWTYSMQT